MYKKSHTANSVFVLLVFGLFAVTSLVLVLIGANVYRGIVRDTDCDNEIRASLSYVANKVRSNDTQGVIAVEKEECGDVLTLTSYSGERAYKTYIYFYNGQLMELFSRADSAFKPQSGFTVAGLEDFTVQKNGNALTFSATGRDRRSLSMQLCLRSAA